MKDSFFRKFASCLTCGVLLAALWLLLGNSGTLAWFPPVVVFSLAGLSLLGAFVFPFVWQYRQSKSRIDSARVYGLLNALIRYCIAFNLASFGWKKLFGLQFVVPLSVAAGPMNQQSGEWLTWYYFGYSLVYGCIIAIIQISGSLMILFQRTLLLGAVILFALMFNLTLINIFYHMNAGALLQSVVVTIGLVYLILLDYNKLIVFFLSLYSNKGSITPFDVITKNVVRLSAIILSLLFTIYLKSLVK